MTDVLYIYIYIYRNRACTSRLCGARSGSPQLSLKHNNNICYLLKGCIEKSVNN